AEVTAQAAALFDTDLSDDETSDDDLSDAEDLFDDDLFDDDLFDDDLSDDDRRAGGPESASGTAASTSVTGRASGPTPQNEPTQRKLKGKQKQAIAQSTGLVRSTVGTAASSGSTTTTAPHTRTSLPNGVRLDAVADSVVDRLTQKLDADGVLVPVSRVLTDPPSRALTHSKVLFAGGETLRNALSRFGGLLDAGQVTVITSSDIKGRRWELGLALASLPKSEPGSVDKALLKQTYQEAFTQLGDRGAKKVEVLVPAEFE